MELFYTEHGDRDGYVGLSHADLHEATANTGDEHTRTDGDFSTTGLNDKVNGVGSTVLDAELLTHRLGVAFRVLELVLTGVHGYRQVDIGRRVRLGELETTGDDINGDDTLGTHCAGGSHADQSDRAGTEDDNTLVGPELPEGVT